jgi:uncharacterized membrane protein YhhN
MFRHVADRDEEDRDVVIDHPNRHKAGSKATRAIVVLLLLVSAGLTAVVTFGGWDKLAGMKPIVIAYIVLYLVMAFFVLRWSRGKAGFTNPALSADLLGLITLIIVPVQVLLIAFAMRGFQQAWNVEEERPRSESGGYEPRGEPQPA